MTFTGPKIKHFLWLVAVLFIEFSLNAQTIQVGAAQWDQYKDLIVGKKVGFVGNHTSYIDDLHTVDFLISKKVEVVKLFSPEHGFRGTAAAGEKVKSGKDAKTGLPLVSLYGKNKKPSSSDFKGLDIVVFDIQDVGARFYTYISTLTLVMERCAQEGIPIIVLDRPNPLGWYIDGPVLKEAYKSFVGMHPVPVVYGMTIGEYGKMVNGEGWLNNTVKAELHVIPCKGYTHKSRYTLPIKPSPNLPNHLSILLYPSLCFFEGTNVSIGRGTDFPFQVVGAPYFPETGFSFTPKSVSAAPNPKHLGKVCRGYDLRDFAKYWLANQGQIYLPWLIESYRLAPDKEAFFNSFFDKLAGTDQLQIQIKKGWNETQIRAQWDEEIRKFKGVREKYLIYP